MTRPIKVLLVAMAAVFCLGLVTAAVGIYFAVNVYRGTSEFRDGYAAMMRGDHSTAISKFTEAMGKPLAKDYRTFALEDRAFSEAAQNKRDDAIRDYTEALRSQPKLSFAYSARGELYDVKGEKDKAVSDYSEAIKLDP